MDAIIIWLGNNAVASIFSSSLCAFLVFTGLVFWTAVIYNWLSKIRIKKNYFVKKDEK